VKITNYRVNKNASLDKFFVTKNVTMTKKAVKHKNLQALKSLTLPLEMLKQALLQWCCTTKVILPLPQIFRTKK
jgi:hypothetical protein